jgi:hypothetical protein
MPYQLFDFTVVFMMVLLVEEYKAMPSSLFDAVLPVMVLLLENSKRMPW